MSEIDEQRTLPPFPINDETLAQLQHALDTSDLRVLGSALQRA